MMYAKQALLGLALAGGFLGNPFFGRVPGPFIGDFYTITDTPSAANTSSAPSPNQNYNTVAPETPTGNNLSANWAGYVAAAANTSYTAVGATWTVPTVSSDSSTAGAADATWVGIGGVNSQDLIQSGTQAIVQNGQVSYQAWVETLPDVLQSIPLSVSAGDLVTVSLAEQSAGHWGLTFYNNTTGQQYQTTIAYDSSHSSAEWIEEMPVGGSGHVLGYIPLDDFGSVAFQNGYTVANGSTQTISVSGAEHLSMVNDSRTLLASTSGLDASGAAFTVTRTSASAVQTAAISAGGRWHRTGTPMRHSHTASTPSSSASSTDPSTASQGTSQTVTQVSITLGQWTSIPFGGDGWLQILFR